ncbi:MAG TPA: hypothetical protein PKA28_03120 [Methylomusa anaerophila]|uniref:Uncharacterized protein n=1 Tax=Methylomusa anaerophila TaxID=1930071 RepID=A0A348ANT3_9FIRM|nr:hypothetical protein [Methylomusa anaerophila]BBB92731.1 hypothetical protein MAMMFC1_03426 [Methylomusa anaerophila]HML87416.1 hypothetical protein [Methylomusa anaerophila]
MSNQEKLYSFALFEPHRTRIPKKDDPLVEVRPNGRIIFNKKACQLLGQHHFCMLGYDPENRALGILPITELKPNSFPIRYATKGAYIGAKKFFKHFNILPDQFIENEPFQSGDFIGINL